jgi:hypothetical protein
MPACCTLQQDGAGCSVLQHEGCSAAQHAGAAFIPRLDATARHWQQHIAIHIASR